MESKRLTWFLAGIGGWLGGYIPSLWNASYFSFSSIIFSSLGAIVGIWVAFKITRY